MDWTIGKKIIIECLRKEGVATPDRLLYAFQALQGLSKRSLMEIVEKVPDPFQL